MRATLLTLVGCLAFIPSLVWGQETPATPSRASAAVVVPGDRPLLHTRQLVPRNVRVSAKEQLDSLLDQLERILRANGSAMGELVKVNFYAANQEAVAAIDQGLTMPWVKSGGLAASLVVTPLPQPGALVALDAVAMLPKNKAGEVRITKDGAVLPPGARVWVSGQAEKGDLAQATRLTMESLRKTLRFVQMDDKTIVQLKAFLRPMSDVAVAQKEIARFFGDQPVPPVVYVEWKNNLPIEIELVAWGGQERPGEAVEYLTPPALKPSPVYSRVARVNHGPLIYIAGLHPTKAGQPGEEIVNVFGQLGQILPQTGSDFRHLVKATYYVLDDATTKKWARSGRAITIPSVPPPHRWPWSAAPAARADTLPWI